MGKFVDMTGWVMAEHGVPDSRIVVVKRGPDAIISGKKVVQWWCNCTCGQHEDLLLISGASLRSGNTLSCGCLQKEVAHNLNFKDITGMTFGRWYVICRVDCPEGLSTSDTYWLCECLCDKHTRRIVSGHSLRLGRSMSCGCLGPEKMWQKTVDKMVGKKINHLIVLERTEDRISENGNRHPMYKCKCDCEEHNIVIVDGYRLEHGLTKSCGCIRKNATTKWFAEHKNHNYYEDNGDYYVFYASNNLHPFYIDDCDFDRVYEHYWFQREDGYIATNTSNRETILLHRFIMQPDEETQVDHKYGSDTRHDNRRYNLRFATPSKNAQNKRKLDSNTSGVTGVYLNNKTGMYIAQIGIDNNTIFLGSFINKKDAEQARKEAEEKYFGEFSRYNSREVDPYVY